MIEHPSLKSISKSKESLEEELKRKITELQTETLDTKERLDKIMDLKQKFTELQEQQNVLQSQQKQELDELEKEALKLIIQRLKRS